MLARPSSIQTCQGSVGENYMDQRSRSARFCASCLVLLLCSIPVLLTAQVQNGQFTGVVTDPSGAAIPNAKVTVTNTATNLAITTSTSQSGLFVARELPPGTYKITAEAPGFKTVSSTNVTLYAGNVEHVDLKMPLGEAREVVEVTDAVAAVNTEDSKLASTITSTQVANLPLNGRNIYDLMLLSPGAINNGAGGDQGKTSEAGPTTIVNGTRQNFNGFLINGVSNKDLSGGPNNIPVEDSIQEFQQLTLNMSAQYGNSAGSITNLITKGGTNTYHGSAWEFNRNDVFDANDYFLNHNGVKKPPLHFNQFGGTLGGPIVKDKLFFFASYQGDRFKTVQPPTPVLQETPEWRAAVAAALPNSVANLLYSTFPPTANGTTAFTLNTYVPGNSGIFGADFATYLCPDSFAGLPNANQIAQNFQKLLGVSSADLSAMTANGCSSVPGGPVTGTMNRDAPFLQSSVINFGSQTINNLFNGNEASLRLDYTPSDRNRFFAQFNYLRQNDVFGPFNASLSSARGFLSPTRNFYPNFQVSFVHTFSPTLLNEFRAGYTLKQTAVLANIPGVPQAVFDDGTAGFGSYNGYPQFFKDHVYSYSDMLSINHGNHNMKVGADFRRNIENSEFNVGRPSYYFNDQLMFAADLPYQENAGVDPGIISGQPPFLATNKRHWRNLEVGAYFQDDWKMTRRLTVNLGLRYDLYTRHTEENGLVTNFLLGPGTNLIDNFQTGAGQVHDASPPCLFNPGDILNKAAGVAGVCGPGGFTAAKSLGQGDHNNFGPRVGFAYDVFGNGRTSLRGGFGMSYEGTLYNPLSNSRWNAPFYSFNQVNNAIAGGIGDIVYGPTVCGASLGTCSPSSAAATFTGPPTNPGMGTGVQATGNIVGWAPNDPNLSFRSGLIFPSGIRDPYVYSYFLGVQHEIGAKLVTEVNYVGTAGHKLFRAEDINRIPGGRLPLGGCTVDNFGRTICGQTDTSNYPGTAIAINPLGTLNPNFGQLRNWRNVNNSNYNSLQASLRKQASHGLTFNVSYTYSHSIDNGSAWHNSATTGNGAGAGDGYSTDFTLPFLDRGNSTFDIRQRLVLNYVWELPIARGAHGVMGAVAGGWQLNGIWSVQTGAHWEPYDHRQRKLREISSPTTPCTAADVNSGNCQNLGGDYNLDGERIDRPNAAAVNFTPSKQQWTDGWGSAFAPGAGFFTSPCLGCVGNLGRNTFVGPKLFDVDMSLFKNFRITERVALQFRAESFNMFNHTNFKLPGANFANNNRIDHGNFGQASGAFDPRELQFGLKLSF